MRVFPASLASPALLGLAALGVVACRVPAAAPVAAPAVTLPAVPAAHVASVAAPRRALVWTEDADGHQRTWTVDEAGDVMARADGVRVAAGGHVWAWKETVGSAATQACPSLDANGNEVPGAPQPPPGRSVRATLQRVDGASSQEVVRPVDEPGAQEIEQSVELMATVGPYLFVRTEVFAYACGAHGNTADAFVVWDAAAQGVAWGNAGGSDEGWTEGAPLPLERALAVFAGEDDVKAFADENGRVDATLTEIVPSFAREGGLEVRYQFTAFTCYACGDGSWSSYSKSTRLDAPRVPAPLRAWTAPAPGVRAFALVHPELTVGGWSLE